MTTSDDLLQAASRLLKTSADRLHHRSLPDDDATYFWVAERGGGALILANDGTALFASSAVSPEAHLEAFRGGRRTPADQFEG